MEYKLSTWKLEVSGEFDTEEEAIKILSDRYMRCSKCDPPGEHIIEAMMNSSGDRTTDNIAKRVYFYVKEPIYGNLQWVHKLTLNIYPFKQEHWWESIDENNPFVFSEIDFRYKIVTNEAVI